MRNLTQEEMELVSGGYFLKSDPQGGGSISNEALADYVSGIGSAACGWIPNKGVSLGCAAGAVYLGRAIESGDTYYGSDPMDTKLGINQQQR